MSSARWLPIPIFVYSHFSQPSGSHLLDPTVKYCIWKKNAPAYENHKVFGETPESSGKVLFKLDFLLWRPSLFC
jgi:hypothetical protein